MIVGIGTDLIQVHRIERVLKRFPERFAKRILAEEETAEYEACRNRAVFLAKRFAVKEAAAKALGTGIRHGVQFIDFIVMHNGEGQPQLVFTGCALEIAKSKNVRGFHVSVTDDMPYVRAFVVLES